MGAPDCLPLINYHFAIINIFQVDEWWSKWNKCKMKYIRAKQQEQQQSWTTYRVMKDQVACKKPGEHLAIIAESSVKVSWGRANAIVSIIRKKTEN